MPDQGQSPFAHRHNSDGTFDSICKKCFYTVSRALEEKQLSEDELTHVCGELSEWQKSARKTAFRINP